MALASDEGGHSAVGFVMPTDWPAACCALDCDELSYHLLKLLFPPSCWSSRCNSEIFFDEMALSSVLALPGWDRHQDDLEVLVQPH